MKTHAKSARQKTRSRWPVFAGIIVVALLAGWIIMSILQPATSASSSTGRTGVQVGNLAPDFTVPTLDGNQFRLSENQGKPTLIYFTAYWCGTCIPKAQELGQLYQEYSGRVHIVVLDVDPTSTLELLDQFKQAAGNGAFVWAFDSDSKVATTYLVNALSTIIFLDGERRIVYRGQFPTSYAALKGELEKLIQ